MAARIAAPRWSKEYTIPIEGTPLYRTQGIIKAVTEYGHYISVGKITREVFDDEEFQYIFQPYWEIIDGLPASIFQGIPGINMDRRQKEYYRVNYEPVFITERSPSKNREDLWELLESVGLDYYDRFEWLLRTDMRAGNDNLIVEPIYNNEEKAAVDYVIQESEQTWRIEKYPEKDVLSRMIHYMQYGDVLKINKICQLGNTSQELTENLFLLAGNGIEIVTEEGWRLDKESISVLIPVLWSQIELYRNHVKDNRERGIQRAKKEGKYRGRKKIDVPDEHMDEICRGLDNGTISVKEAMNQLDLKSRSTFYRRLREYKERIDR